jgi:hypothetical protein
MAQGDRTQAAPTETDDRDMQDGGLGSATEGDRGAPPAEVSAGSATTQALADDDLDDDEVVPS